MQTSPSPTKAPGASFTPDKSARDPVVQILITSHVPGTKPLIVRRKLSQRLKEVRLAWCAKQAFPDDFAQQIFLTWQNKRLYDVTLCQSLGLSSSYGDGFANHDLDEDLRIELEATTDETVARLRAEKAKKADKQRVDGSAVAPPVAKSHAAHNGQPDGQDTPTKSQDTNIRLIIKSKDAAEFRLKVRPVWPHSTSIACRLSAACKATANKH